LLAVREPVSVTCTVKVAVVLLVGVPLRAPVVLSEMPDGRLPSVSVQL
jgi:hypothetical protein